MMSCILLQALPQSDPETHSTAAKVFPAVTASTDSKHDRHIFD